MTPLRLARLLCVATLAAGCFGTAVAHAAPSTVPAGSVYVALGSSYASGPDIAPVADTTCRRSGANYPHRLAAALRLRLIDVTCAGATTADVLGHSQRSPVAAVTLPPQLTSVTPDARLVTMTIGGNDLGYIGYLEFSSCLSGRARNPSVTAGAGDRLCSVAGGPAQPGAADYDRVRDRITDIVARIRQQAPHATVVLVQYLPVLRSDGATCATVPLTPARAAAAVRIHRELAIATATAARRTGALLIATAAAAGDHTACAATPWSRGYTGSGAPAEPESYHPNSAGMAAVADLVRAQL